MLNSLAIVAKLEEAGLAPDVVRSVAALMEHSQIELEARLLTFQTFDVRIRQHEIFLREMSDRIDGKLDASLHQSNLPGSDLFPRLQDSYIRTQIGLAGTRRKLADIYAVMDLALRAVRRKVDRLIQFARTIAILLAIAIGILLFALYKTFYQQPPVAALTMLECGAVKRQTTPHPLTASPILPCRV